MLATVLWLLLGAWLISGGALAIILVRAPYLPDFDEHAAVATALLQPDAPLFTATDEALLAFATEWLDYVDSLPCTQES